jgi:uncharacterized protein YndB with AHSA1/START domain
MTASAALARATAPAVAAADYGVVSAASTLTIERLLPGPLERVWAYVTESELRRLWLAAGDMPLTPGATFTLTWRNDELSDPPGERPEGFGEEHTMTCEMLEVDAPHRLAFRFGNAGTVTITLEKRGERVLLRLVHAGAPNRSVLLSVSAGWHAHLDILVARLCGDRPEAFWTRWASLKEEYDARLGD